MWTTTKVATDQLITRRAYLSGSRWFSLDAVCSAASWTRRCPPSSPTPGVASPANHTATQNDAKQSSVPCKLRDFSSQSITSCVLSCSLDALCHREYTWNGQNFNKPGSGEQRGRCSRNECPAKKSSVDYLLIWRRNNWANLRKSTTQIHIGCLSEFLVGSLQWHRKQANQIEHAWRDKVPAAWRADCCWTRSRCSCAREPVGWDPADPDPTWTETGSASLAPHLFQRRSSCLWLKQNLVAPRSRTFLPFVMKLKSEGSSFFLNSFHCQTQIKAQLQFSSDVTWDVESTPITKNNTTERPELTLPFVTQKQMQVATSKHQF